MAAINSFGSSGPTEDQWQTWLQQPHQANPRTYNITQFNTENTFIQLNLILTNNIYQIWYYTQWKTHIFFIMLGFSDYRINVQCYQDEGLQACNDHAFTLVCCWIHAPRIKIMFIYCSNKICCVHMQKKNEKHQF
jgi:hypothetical protein